MRIRSIHPEFWRSEDIAALDWDTRLLFIGLWSYVDDNGVGRDNEKLIKAELFPLEDDPRETLATVSRGLQTLSDGGQIDRYEVDGKPFLYICAWPKWQKIDRPGKERYPLPTCENATPRESLATVSRQSRETPSTGEGEKGRRGEVKTSPPADAGDDFDVFWSLYPRKVKRAEAARAWIKARRRADTDTILDGLRRYIPEWAKKSIEYTPHASSWLNGERWNDEITTAPKAEDIDPIWAQALGGRP